VTYVVAAGNENANAYYSSPAGLPAAITVAATDSRDRRAPFSNWGSTVDLFAPGVGIRSAYPGSTTATAVLNGTSMAAPHVTGAAALVLDAAPTYRPAQVLAFLVGQATTGRVTDRKGAPDRLLYVPRPPAAPVIKTTALPAGQVGQPYSAQLALTTTRRGTWSLAGGALPPGLRLSSTGLISGTPTTATATRTIIVKFTDYVPQSATRTLSIVVRG
jgi:subtilisin family serine protease